MEHRIQVLSVRTSLKNKTITLTCSADIDEDTVTPDTVCLALPSSAEIVPIKLECDRRKIIVTIIPEILINTDYRLTTTKEIESIVGESLEPLKALKVVFESAVVTDVQVISPVNFETTEEETELKWQETGKEEDLCNRYQIQIATDNGFFNVSVDNIIDGEDSFKVTLPANQYFVRIRAIKEPDYGKWSPIVTFTVPKEKPLPVPNPQPEPKSRPGIPEIVDYTKDDEPIIHGQEKEKLQPATMLTSDKMVYIDDELPQTFEFVFDGAVNIDQATVVIKRRDS